MKPKEKNPKFTEKEKKIIAKEFTKGNPDFSTWRKQDKDIWATAVLKSLGIIK